MVETSGQQYHVGEKPTVILYTQINTKSPKLNPAIIEEVQHRPAAPTAGDSVPLVSTPTLEETRRAIRGMHNWKVPGPDSLVAELLKMDEPAEPIVLERFHAILVEVWNGGKSRSSGKTPPSSCSTRSRSDPTVITTGGSHFSRTQSKCF